STSAPGGGKTGGSTAGVGPTRGGSDDVQAASAMRAMAMDEAMVRMGPPNVLGVDSAPRLVACSLMRDPPHPRNPRAMASFAMGRAGVGPSVVAVPQPAWFRRHGPPALTLAARLHSTAPRKLVA